MTEETAQRIAAALERIADAFEQTPAAPEPTPCQLGQHPQEYRTSHAVMGAAGRYECDPHKGGCGFRNF